MRRDAWYVYIYTYLCKKWLLALCQHWTWTAKFLQNDKGTSRSAEDSSYQMEIITSIENLKVQSFAIGAFLPWIVYSLVLCVNSKIENKVVFGRNSRHLRKRNRGCYTGSVCVGRVRRMVYTEMCLEYSIYRYNTKLVWLLCRVASVGVESCVVFSVPSYF